MRLYPVEVLDLAHDPPGPVLGVVEGIVEFSSRMNPATGEFDDAVGSIRETG